MAIPRKKIIFALIPFVITTLAILIFLIFFYWGEITFQGNSPFVVQHNGTEYPDQNGSVSIRARAGMQTFMVRKEQYQEQTIEREIAWTSPNIETIHFVYQSKVASNEPFIPTINYVNPISVNDNQLSDIVISNTDRKIALPAGINNVIWNRSGDQACLLHTGSGSIQNQLLTSTKDGYSIDALPGTVFDCQNGPKTIHTIGTENNQLKINNNVLSLGTFAGWQINSSLYSNELFITIEHAGDLKRTIVHYDIDRDHYEEWGSWETKGAIRVIGPQTIAIPLAQETLIYSNKQALFSLPIYVDSKSVVINATRDTLYYIDIDRELSFKNVFQTNQPPKHLFQQALSSEKPVSIQQLNDDQELVTSTLSPDLTQAWYLFDKPSSRLLKIDIGPTH